MSNPWRGAGPDLRRIGVIAWDGDTWRVQSCGAEAAGKTYCHLASTTRFVGQKNGKRPVQVGEWIPNSLLFSSGGSK